VFLFLRVGCSSLIFVFTYKKIIHSKTKRQYAASVPAYKNHDNKKLDATPKSSPALSFLRDCKPCCAVGLHFPYVGN